MPLPTNCLKCSFKLAPMVYIPHGGNTTNVLHCMNCGWAVEITPEDAAGLNAASEGVSLNDRQWEMILEFMGIMLRYRGEIVNAELHQKINQELAAINVRSSNPPQSSMPSVPEGSDPTSSNLTEAVQTQLDLEQGSDGKES